MSRWLAGLRVALRSVFRRKRVEDELNEELQYHLDRQIAEGLRAGLAPSEARYAALRTMGAVEKAKEECRDVRSGNLVSDFTGDLRYAGRALRRSPGFALLAVAIMALGIGANTAVFSVVSAVLLRPLPYPGADRIVAISTSVVSTGERNPLVTLANFRDWRDQSSVFEAMATYRGGEAPVSPGATAEYGRHANVDAEFFRVLAVTPAIGRTWTPEELVPGNDHPAVIISHGYWQSRFGGDPAVVGRTLRLGNNPWHIVGVMPPGFQFPNRTDIWSPQTGRGPASRTSHSFLAVGRLKPGVSLEQAQAELSAVATRLEQQYPDSNRGRGVAIRGLQEQLVGDVRMTLYLLWGVVGVVLMIACANAATLLLGKATARTREVAVRAALGASRRRIVRQLVTESLLLAVVAGGCSMVLASWGARVLAALTPIDVVRQAEPRLDGGVLVFTLAVSLATTVLFGLVPALHAAKVDLIGALKHAGARAGSSGRAMRTRSVLVVSEIALAVVLLTAAGLLMKSLTALHGVDLGYRPENALVMKATGVRSLQETNAFFREVMSRIAALPGVVAVGATMVPPGDLTNSGNGAYFIDRVPETRDRTKDPFADFNVITPGTFAASGIPLRSGRDFNDGDITGQPMVAIVNEALVRKSFNGANPIGRAIFCSFDSKEAMTIIGVVGDVRQRNPAIEPLPDCYMPYTQHTYNNRMLHVIIRTVGDPLPLAGALRRLAAEASPEVPVSFETMEATVSKGVETPRFRALLFGVFAGLAVCLAMAGVYGLMAFAVQQRAKEVGLRMALGASRGTVMRLILEQGFVLAAAGLTVGLAAAAAATRLLRTMLFDVQPLDLEVYLAVAVVLGLVTLLAGYLPARRAAGMNPVEILKAE
jgi:putative ABC transport system permease protein